MEMHVIVKIIIINREEIGALMFNTYYLLFDIIGI